MANGTPKRLSGPALLGNTAATIYTAPSYIPNTMVTVVRKIHVNNVTALVHYLTMSIGADAAGTEIFTSYPIPPNTALDFPGPYTIVQAGTIQAFADTASTLNVTMDGLENVGP